MLEDSLYIDEEYKSKLYIKIASYIILGVLFLCLFLKKYLFVISLIEVISVIFCFKIVIKSIKVYKKGLNNQLIVLWYSYLFITIFNLIYLICYYEIIILQMNLRSITSQLHSISTITQSISLLIFLMITNDKMKIKLKINVNTFIIMISSILIFLILYFDTTSIYELFKKNTITFKVFYRYFKTLIFIITIFFLIQKQEYFSKNTIKLIFLSIIFNKLENVSKINIFKINKFMSIIPHGFKLLSILFLYLAIIKISKESSYFKEKLIKKKLINKTIETSINGIMITDIKGVIIYVNQSFLKLWGYNNVNEVIGTSVINLWHDVDDANYFRDIVLTSGSWNGEIIAKRKDGSKFEVEVFPNVIRDEFGNIAYITGSIIDISHKKNAAIEIEKSRELYEKLVKLSPNAIFVKKENEVILANEQALKLFKCKNEIEVNDIIFGNIENDNLNYTNIFSDKIDKLKNEETMINFIEQKIVLRDESIIDVELSGASFKHDNDHYMIIVIKDLSEKKTAEELEKTVLIKDELLKAAREYDKLKTQFFSNISHEFKTPLNIIFGAVQLIDNMHKDYKECTHYNKMEKYTNIMRQNSYRLLRLINNLIDITKVDSGFFKIKLENHNIINIIEDITLSVVEYAKSKDITVLFDTEVEEKIIACDPDKIERIILNLLSNAIKFTDPNGSIYVNTYEKEESIIISIKDTGIGIPEDKLNKIFERFDQVDATLTRKNEGSGIGLSLVKALVEAHGGNVYVKSSLGKGSEFIVEFPCNSFNNDNFENINVYEDDKDRLVEKINVEFSDIYEIEGIN